MRVDQGQTRGIPSHRLLLAAGLVFALLWVGFAGLAARAGTDSIGLDQTKGLRGTSVHLTGTFPPPDSPRAHALYWDDPSFGNVLSERNFTFDSGGKTSLDFDIPYTECTANGCGRFVPPGTHTVTFCIPGDTQGCTIAANASFTIPAPKFNLNRKQARAGEVVVGSGENFEPKAQCCSPGEVTLYWVTGSNLQFINSFSEPNSAGTWGPSRGTFTVPQDATFGNHAVLACNAIEGCDPGFSDSSSIEVPRPHLSLSRGTGRVGDPVTITGSGMYSDAPTRVFFGPSSAPLLTELPHAPDTRGNGQFGPFTVHLPADATTGTAVITVCTVDPERADGGCRVGSPGATATNQKDPNFDAPSSRLRVLAPTPTPSPSPSPTPRPTPTASPQPTPTPTPQPTPQPTPTASPRPTPQPTPTASPRPTPSPTPRPTPSPTPRPTPSPTPRPTPTPTATPVPSSPPTPTQAPTSEPTPSQTAQPTLAPTPTAAPGASLTLASSPSPSATSSPSEAPSPTTSASPTTEPTVSPTTTATESPTVAPTSTEIALFSATASPSARPTEASAPTPTATPSPAVAVIPWQGHLATPSGSGLGDIAVLGSSGLLALLIAFLVPFPGTLFNKTVEANYEEIQGWFGRVRSGWRRFVGRVLIGPLAAVRTAGNGLLGGLAGVWLCLVLTAAVYGFLSPTFGLDWDSLGMFLGLFVGFAFITLAFDLPLRVYHRRRSEARDRGFLRALWLTLPVALICVLVSRLAHFQPGYMYGLIISIIFTAEISSRDEGVGTWLASLWLLVLSIVAWILLEVVRQQTGSTWLQSFLETALVTFVVAGIEALAVGLLPIRFLPGHPLYHWRRSMWFPLFTLAIFGYILILVNPVNGYLSDDSVIPMLVGVIFLVSFGIVSVGTWGYFRYRPARIGLDRRGEAADRELAVEDSERAERDAGSPTTADVTLSAAVTSSEVRLTTAESLEMPTGHGGVADGPTAGAPALESPTFDGPLPEGGSTA